MLKQREIIKKTALDAGKAILAIKPTEGVVQKKGRANFVTEADLKSEKIIIDLILKSFPDHLILSEETNDNISDPLSVEHLWVIDPIDGTNNFKNERNYSCISIGYVEKGITQLGIVYDPFRDEMFYAERMQGAFLNGKKISVSDQQELFKSTVACDNSYDPEGTRFNVEMFLKIKQSPWFLIKGSATLTMCEVAAGRTDLYFHNYLRPWDNAAAFLILEEAGAVLKSTQGEDVNFLSESVVCGNEILAKQFLTAIS